MREARPLARRGAGARVFGWLIAALALANVAALPVDRIDAAVKRAYPKQPGPGAIVALVDDGKILHVATAGFADVASKRAWTVRTHVDLASVSKAFTAWCALKLVEQGKLSLATDVRDHLPELDRSRYSRPISLEHLLSMTAGLPSYEDQVEDLADVDNEGVAKVLGGLEPEFEPGTKYEYSNAAYAMAALIVKRLAGEPFPRFAKRTLFDPAGMSSTFVLDTPGTPVPERATGYHAKGKRKAKRFQAVINDTRVVGDGQVFTCVRDMARWEHALRHSTLLSRRLAERAFSEAKLADGTETEYGFGWTLGGTDAAPIAEHAGSWDGTATFFRVRLSGGISLVVFSNDDESDPNRLADKLDEILDQ